MMEEIPPGIYTYKDWPEFVKYPKNSEDATWHVWGPIDKVAGNTVVEVVRYNQPKEPVHILEHVAHREVRKRNGSKIVFVMATFDNVVQEEPE